MAKTNTLGRIHTESRLAPENRIFVNRNLRMTNTRAIGFDLDHTLAHYRGPAVEELAYRLTRGRLVERCGYPEQLLRIPYDRSFVIRGLVIDKRRGNILKMDYHNYVSRGYHGQRLLGAGERKSAYRSGRVRLSSDRYVTVDTLFHLPEAYLYVVLVDLMEKQKGKKNCDFDVMYDDVRNSIDSVHGDGSLKREILGNLGKFIRKDPRVGPTLEEFRRVGKKLFLLTNSEYYYSDAILKYLLDHRDLPDWRELFDVIVVESGKPAFFSSFDRRAEDESQDGFKIYRAGNARFLERQLGFRGDQIIYFGDHTYGDILRSKKTLGWRTAMVVEELREEMEAVRRAQPQLDELNHCKSLRGVLESDLSALDVERRKLERKLEAQAKDEGAVSRLRRRQENLERESAQLETELDGVRRMTTELGDRINESYNPHWGPIFREGQETSRFGHQVKDFACLYMTRVSNFLYYNLNHYFRSAAELMPHELI